MTNLFLVPTVNPRARENFERTIRRRVPLEDLSGLSLASLAAARSVRGGVWAWGSKPGKEDVNVSTWNAMARGDWVLFYFDGWFPVCGRVVVRERSPAVAKRLWGEDEGQTWEYMYLLDEVRQVDVPRLPALEKLGYRPSFYPRGFTRVDRDLGAEYGSVERVLEELAGVGHDFHSVVGAAKAGDEAAALLAVDQLDQMSERALLASLASFLASEPPAVRREVVRRIKRNRKLVRHLKRLYKDECQVCGFTFEKGKGGRYCEAAHLRPISLLEANLDVKDNLVVLCPNHHKMLDYGAMSIDFDPEKKKLYAVIDGSREQIENRHVGF
jgi:5-methylcytosine-specific restriction endonuclease McrA